MRIVQYMLETLTEQHSALLFGTDLEGVKTGGYRQVPQASHCVEGVLVFPFAPLPLFTGLFL